MFCSYCKATISETDSYCLNCGKNISNVKNESEFICEDCENDIPADALYCWNCGVFVESEDQESVQTLSQQSTEQSIAIINEAEETKTELSTDKKRNLLFGSLQKDKDWFIEVEENSDSKSFYGKEQLLTDFRDGILEGKYSRDGKIIIHHKDKNGAWKQTESTTYEIAKNHFKLRVLYEPVWAHAMAGLKWGAIVGVILKLLDTVILLDSVNPTLALLFLGAIIVVFIPRIGMIGVIAVVILSMKYSNANLFLIGIVAALTGAILGCLPGMAIGGIVGFSRKNVFSPAKDALPDPAGLVLKAVILPLISGIAIIAIYILVVIPWMISILE